MLCATQYNILSIQIKIRRRVNCVMLYIYFLYVYLITSCLCSKKNIVKTTLFAFKFIKDITIIHSLITNNSDYTKSNIANNQVV